MAKLARALCALLLTGCCHAATVTLVRDGDGWQLRRDGQPYVIKGAAGGGSKAMLRECGANSTRTWGADGILGQLDEADKLGLTVTVGIWLGHKEHGFDWHNEKMVADQFARAKKNVLAYRDHPALLCWALGNEMEIGVADDPVMWKAINDLAVMVHELDPKHPTMTVTAEIGGHNVKNIHELCPAIDIVGINSYAGSPSLPERYAKAGGTKPYVITEYGPPGTWEFWRKTPWGAADEFTSVEKVEWYAKSYTANVVGNAKHCLGSYAFIWGSKQEASATWFGLLLPDGSKLNPVDALTELWSGQPAAKPCPRVAPLKVDGPRQVEPNTPLTVHLEASDPSGGPLDVKWVLTGEPKSYNTGGANEAPPPVFPDCIVKADATHAELKIPGGGRYRLFAYVRNHNGGAAMANIALFVTGSEAVMPGGRLPLPLTVYAEAGEQWPWIPSGYMGDNANIKMTPDCTEQPHAGQTCLKCEFTKGDGWGGVVWQDPANDWGNAAGGYDLRGATQLSFWARGANGGESVSFSFGLLDRDKKFYDTANGSLKDVSLTKEWRQYTLDVTGKALQRIKTGFCWVVGAKGQPVTFYLDDIVWSGDGTATPAAPTGGKPGALPLAVYSEAGGKLPWIPSGYMGNTGAIKMQDDCRVQPHAGATCLKVTYDAPDNWAGVVWQDPENDWKGERPGGWNVTGAKALTFWARGEKGGEVVSFSFGLVGREAKFADSAKGALDKVKLGTEWKQYRIDLADKDLTRLKTGFCWVVGGQGAPLTFYLDDVQYE